MPPSVKAFLNVIIKEIVNPTIYLMFGIALFLFIWGMMPIIQGSDDPGEREKAGKHILYGSITIAVMLSMWTIVRLLANTIGITLPATL